LHRFFISDQSHQPAIDRIAQSYFDFDYEIKPMLKQLFNSDEFKNSAFDRVRWPVEHVVNIVNIAGVFNDPYENGFQALVSKSALMGQELLNPPSVEGWHTGREWIDSSFLIERVNYAVEMLGNPDTPGMKNILQRIGSDHTSISLLDLMDACLYELGCVELDEKTKSILLSELGQEEPIVIDANFGQRVGQVMELIVASREFQLS